MTSAPVILVHGGAKPIPAEKAEEFRAGCRRAADTGWATLAEGGSALEAVEAAIRVLEDDPTFNAGCGAVLNPDGVARLDAGIMDGATLEAGAVAVVEGIPHPITLARTILSGPEVLIAGEFARSYAKEKGVEVCPPEALITPEQWQAWKKEYDRQEKRPSANDTVGAVALDRFGKLAAGVSTGGTGDRRPGRVGDSASVGAGFYADNEENAASALTGEGEAILRVALARTAVGMTRGGARDPEEVAAEALSLMERRTGGKGGILILDRRGRIGWSHSDKNMAVGYRTERQSCAAAFVHKSEERERP